MKKKIMGWIGVDLDGTFAKYHMTPETWDGSIGEPIQPMLDYWMI